MASLATLPTEIRLHVVQFVVEDISRRSFCTCKQPRPQPVPTTVFSLHPQQNPYLPLLLINKKFRHDVESLVSHPMKLVASFHDLTCFTRWARELTVSARNRYGSIEVNFDRRVTEWLARMYDIGLGAYDVDLYSLGLDYEVDEGERLMICTKGSGSMLFEGVRTLDAEQHTIVREECSIYVRVFKAWVGQWFELVQVKRWKLRDLEMSPSKPMVFMELDFQVERAKHFNLVVQDQER